MMNMWSFQIPVSKFFCCKMPHKIYHQIIISFRQNDIYNFLMSINSFIYLFFFTENLSFEMKIKKFEKLVSSGRFKILHYASSSILMASFKVQYFLFLSDLTDAVFIHFLRFKPLYPMCLYLILKFYIYSFGLVNFDSIFNFSLNFGQSLQFPIVFNSCLSTSTNVSVITNSHFSTSVTIFFKWSYRKVKKEHWFGVTFFQIF